MINITFSVTNDKLKKLSFSTNPNGCLHLKATLSNCCVDDDFPVDRPVALTNIVFC